MKKIQTTVYRLPCAGFAEKDGTFVNSARWLQWKNAAVPPPGDARLDQDILAQIFLKVRELYRKEGGKFPDPILNLRWTYTQPAHPSLAEVAREINGQALADITDRDRRRRSRAGQQLPGFAWLKDDGTTLCGNWLYCGSWTEAGNMTARRGTDDPSGLGIYPNWAWSWPANRRVLYNRAVVRLAGKPWDPERRQVWWNERRPALGRQRCARLQGRLHADGPHGSVHHEPGRRSGGCSRRWRRSPTGRSPSITSRSRARAANPLHPGAVEQPGGEAVHDRGSTSTATPADGYNDRLHHLPSHRALPLLDQEQSDERAARARAVRRDPGGAGQTISASMAATA